MGPGTAARTEAIFCGVLLREDHVDIAKFTMRSLVLLVFAQVLKVAHDFISCFQGSVFTVKMTWVHGSNRERGISIITNYIPLRLLALTAFLSVSGIALNAASASSKVS